jgi:hypothetical protein
MIAMLQVAPTPVPTTIFATIVQVVTLLIPVFMAYMAYKQKVQGDVSTEHTQQISEVKSLVNGSLGVQVQTGLTSAKALAVQNPTPENIALAENAQKAMDAHQAAQAAINASLTNQKSGS